jgi:NAD(P)-dependent dehydrogenase (short-subunit alcohol dehydrogenase family)
MREWAKTLKNDGVKVFAISPGFLATGLAGIGAEQLKKVSDLPDRREEPSTNIRRWELWIHPRAESSFATLWKGKGIMIKAR